MSTSPSPDDSKSLGPQNVLNFTRFRNVTHDQKKILLEFVKCNYEKIIRDLRTKKNSTRTQWASTKKKFNAIGPTKTPAQWRRTWRLLKSHIKKYINTLDKSYNSCNSATANMSQHSSTPTMLDVSSSGQSDSQDGQDPIEVYDLSDDEDHEVSRRIKEGEEFCSRVMRVVSRIMHEGRVVDDVAKMRLITMNKLKFLLAADDRTDKLKPETQMSITDWLLFDTVIVHQHFDVIGMHECTRKDRLILKILFKLVVAYDIESLIGDQLAEAWAALTLAYNDSNRHCTPMLLQRRWYQLKLATRERYYKFWSLSKGSAEMLNEIVERYKPTPLQEAIVSRYKSLVVAPFIPWKELIKTERVILRERFQSIAMNKKGKSREAPNVHIDVDSHLTNLDTPLQADQNTNIDENITFEAHNQASNTNDIVETNTLENEPSDPVDRSLFTIKEIKSEKFIEVSPIHDEIDAINESTDNNELPINENEIKDSGNSIQPLLPFNVTLSVARQPVLPTITNIFGNVNVPIETLPKISVIAAQKQNEKEIILQNTLFNNNTATSVPIHQVNTDAILNEDPLSESHMNDEFKRNNFKYIDERYSVDGAIKTENNTNLLIPECIYGGEEFTDEVEIKHSFNEFRKDIEDESQLLDGTTYIEPNIDTTEDLCIKEVLSEDNTLISKFTDVDLMNKDSSDTFSIHNEDIDDGTLLLDDGIEVPNDIFANQSGKMDTESTDTDHKYKENEDNPEIDQKILINPLVLTVKLEDMGLLPNKFLGHVYGKDLIDNIYLKSKPVINLIEPKSKRDKKATKKVKLSSNILKKPTNCIYNHKKLHKNPDFNTKLKKFNLSFLSLSQNQLFLKLCKPVTVDVSNAFVSKLVNGIMYLDTNDNADIPNKTIISSQNNCVRPPSSSIQSLTNSKFDVKQVTNMTTLKSIQDTPKYRTIPYKSDIRLVNQRLIKREKTSPLKTTIEQTKKYSTPNFADQIKEHLARSEINDVIEDTNSNKNVGETPSNTKLELHSRNAMLPVLKYNKVDKNYCCWANQRLYKLKIKSTKFYRHPCPNSSCLCCCKTMLEEFYRRKSYTLHNLKTSDLAETLRHYEPPDKLIPLDSNNILLTTTQIPSNFKRFHAFRNYLNDIMGFPEGVDLLPSGQVVWNPVSLINITTQYSEILIKLIKEFNQMNDLTKGIENTGLSNEVKTSLGKLFSKTLTRVTYLSELKYAYSCNGLFFRYDLDSGSLDLTNVAINVSKVPVESEFILPD